jgi:Zn-finger nucleic acid-binding protein
MSEPATTPCPRCAELLTSTPVGGIAVESCAKCTGSLLSNADLVRLLEALSVDLLKTFNPDAHIDACPKEERRLSCPRCTQPFEQGDYCQAGLVTFDRCEHCNVVWLNARELGTMTLIWARMEARYSRTHTANEQFLRDVQQLVDAEQLAHATSRFVFRRRDYYGVYDPFDPFNPV